MTHRWRRLLFGGLIAAGACSLPFHSAQANGAFPAAGQILIDPTDPARIWVNTSAGFALSRDNGRTFHIVCTQAMGYTTVFHAHAAMTPTGAIFMGVPGGVAIGRGDSCDFTFAPDLVDVFVVDVSVDPQGRAIAVGVPADGGQAMVFRSEDDLATWDQLGDDLPADFAPRTVDAAPSDPDVVYVSGIDESSLQGKLLHTINAGNNWIDVDVPGSDSADVAPFIAAVDPNLPQRVYVRLGGAPGRLLRSDDGGDSFTQILELPGFMYAFRLDANGSSAYVGTDQTGLHRLDTASLELADLAAISARCITLDGARVLACGAEASDGFSAGISLDDGMTFSTLLRLSCIEGILPCAAGSGVEATCTPEWPVIENFLQSGLACDAPDPGVGGGGQGASGQGANSEGASGEGAGSATNGGAPASGSGGGDADGDADGCSCVAARSSNVDGSWWCIALLAAAVGRRRERG